MKKIYITIVLSFVLEILISTFLKKNSYFLPLFVFFITMEESNKIKDLKKSLMYSFLIGLIYDIVMTNTYFLNATIFLFISFINKKYNNSIDKNQITFLFYFILEIIIYRLLTALVLIIIKYRTISMFIFIKSILSSILLNLIFLKVYQVFCKKIKIV